MPKKSPSKKKPASKPRSAAAKKKPAAKRGLGALPRLSDDFFATHKVLDKAGVTTGGTLLDRVRRLSEREVLTFNALVDARKQIADLKATHSKAVEDAVAALQRIDAMLAETDDPVIQARIQARIEKDVTAALKSLAPEVEAVFDSTSPIEGPLPDGGVESIVPASTVPAEPLPDDHETLGADEDDFDDSDQNDASDANDEDDDNPERSIDAMYDDQGGCE